jgi:type IV pilus assembly protein PilA
MNTTLKAKLLQHFANKKKEGGFTLIELLVVIIIIGILAAIALPSFLNQANKAKQSEAKTYLGSVNRAQQAYYLENGDFATFSNFTQLGLGIDTATTNYKYSVATDAAELSYGVGIAEPLSSSLKSYLGVYKIGTVAGTGEATTLAALCEALKAPVESGSKVKAQDTLDTTATGGAALADLGLGVAGSPKCDATKFKNLGS